MDFCNVNVRVVYDFEYTTKYGRNIKINSGERLLLIKKTNDDWWQVIRSTDQRPFFVPASYVEEIQAGPPVAARRGLEREVGPPVAARRKQEEPTQSPEADTNNQSSCQPNDSLAMTSSFHTATKSQRGLETKCYSILPTDKHAIVSSLKKEIYSSKSKLLSATMSSSGYNSLCEEIPVFDEDEMSNTVDDVNAQNKNDNLQINDSNSFAVPSPRLDNRQHDVTPVDQVAVDSMLSGERDSSKNSISSSCETLASKLPSVFKDSKKYSNLANTIASSSEVSNTTLVSCLPPSDSLENLSLQIELKTNSIRNTSDSTKISNDLSLNKNNVYSNLEDIISQSKTNPIDNCNILSRDIAKKVTKEKIHDDSKLNEDLCDSIQSSFFNNNLQYHGSFKSDTERQRWVKKSGNEKRLRNFYSCSEESSLDLESTSLPHEQFCNPLDASMGSPDIKRTETSSSIIISNKEIKSATRTDETLQKTEWKEKVAKKQFGSDSQLSHLKATKEKTTSRHSLDSVIEDHVTGSPSKDIDQRKYLSESSKSLVGSHQTNSDKSSVDSLLDIDNDGDFRKVYGGTTSDSLIPTDGEDLVSSDSSETDSIKLAKSKQGEVKNAGSNARKIPLTRRRRVISSRSRLDILQEPPSPVLNQVPTRSLADGWNEYDTSDGRKYFYNSQTKEKRWKPPRRNYITNVDEEEPDGSSDMFVVNLALPSGWKSEIDHVSGHTCYIHLASGAKWFSSTDSEGRVYFFGENSTTSSWTLPETVSENNEEKQTQEVQPVQSVRKSAKSQSMFLSTSLEEPSPLTNISHNWPQLWDGTMCVLKEGPLNKTKITENGKRVRKNWAPSHAVLTELLLLFFKDNKGFPSMMNGHGRPELSVDLNGTVIDCGEKVSSRKHVYLLSTVLGLQVLIQCDSSSAAEQWEAAITAAIHNLPSSASMKGLRNKAESPIEDSKINARIGRSKSMKLKNKNASIEDISVNSAERQTKIRERLKKFFHRRPTVESLVKKGIWKDEPVFGCQLEHVCPSEPPRVPVFVQQCIRCIERSEENMKTDGLYRASGNLSQVQKIRLQVDQNIYSLLEEEEDVHVLAGTLKLFFRELKQPVLPFKSFNKAIHASTNPNRVEKIKEFRELVKLLPPCNHDTLKYLLQHLLRVSQYQEHNRMHIPNIAIVFGPTLMWPQQQSLDMAFDLMQQNLVIECLLSDFHTIFT